MILKPNYTPQRRNFSKNALQFGFYGLFLGFTFPIAGTLLALAENSQSITLDAILHLHLHNVLLQIIDLAPLVLMFAGLILGLKTDQSLRDLSEKKNEKFKSLIEDAAEVIYMTDYKGTFIYFNRRIETVYGYKPDELIGAHFTTLIKPSMLKKVAEFYLSQFENKIPETISDFEIIDKQGNSRWVEQTVILRMKGDRVDGFQCVVRDIDIRIKQEKEILHLNNQLKSKLEEIEAANHELSAFNHTVSHDLRSPLRGISTLTEILQMEYESHLPEEAKGLLSRIISSTTKIHTLVEELLEFSKIGKQEIIKEKVNMSEMVDRILFELLPRDPDLKTSVQLDKLAESYCDKQLIYQVWVNLISNSLKYSGKKDSPLIRIGNYFKNNEQIYFVKDNGAGFDMKYYKKLFGVFSRLHTSDEFTGTGVGLSIVKRIIERHGGKVWAEAESNVGATFYFSLPDISGEPLKRSEGYSTPIFYNQ